MLLNDNCTRDNNGVTLKVGLVNYVCYMSGVQTKSFHEDPNKPPCLVTVVTVCAVAEGIKKKKKNFKIP